jgi:hypothetical protein
MRRGSAHARVTRVSAREEARTVAKERGAGEREGAQAQWAAQDLAHTRQSRRSQPHMTSLTQARMPGDTHTHTRHTYESRH